MKTIFSIVTIGALLVGTHIIPASEDPNKKKNYLCDGDSCIPVEISQYDEAKDKEIINALLLANPGQIPPQVKREHLEPFFKQTVQTINKAEKEQEKAIVDARAPNGFQISCRCYEGTGQGNWPYMLFLH